MFGPATGDASRRASAARIMPPMTKLTTTLRATHAITVMLIQVAMAEVLPFYLCLRGIDTKFRLCIPRPVEC